jgi:hypothetical protein
VARPSPHDRQKTGEIPALLDRHNSKLRRRDPILKGYRSASLKRAPLDDREIADHAAVPVTCSIRASILPISTASSGSLPFSE